MLYLVYTNTNAKTIGVAIQKEQRLFCILLLFVAKGNFDSVSMEFSHKSKAQPLGSLTQELSVIFLGP